MSVPFVTVRAFPALAVLAVLAIALSRGASGAADFSVTRFNDPAPGPCLPDDCSLREAIRAANAAPGPNTIDLRAGSYDLTRTGAGEDAALTGDLDITDDLTITGAGVDVTAIDASPLGDRVFDVLGTATAVDVYALTVTGGGLTGLWDTPGGAFRNAGMLYLHQAVLSGNIADNDYGGGVASYGHLFMEDTTLSGGFSSEGAGITNFGTATLRRVTITDNQASYGAGVQNIDGGSIDIINSTISGNYATQRGGGIYNGASASTINLFSVTVTDNTGDAGGGGIVNSPGGTFNLRNTIISGNTGGFGNPECVGALTEGGYNLIAYVYTVDCSLTGDPTGSIIGTAATLGPLVDNGGPTRTHALLAGSSGINDGNPGGCVDNDFDPLTTDQRHADRYVGGRCDMGAFEFGATPPSPTPTPDVTPAPAILTCIAPPGTVTDGIAELTAILTAGGSPVSGADIQWSDEPGLFSVMPESSTTDGTGTATTQYPVPADAGLEGDETVTATFAGDDTHAPASCEMTFHVVSSHLPTPSATPTTVPGGIQGDTDCDQDVDSVDALWVLKDTAGLPHSAACIERGNIDCDADRDSVDALGILKHVAGLPPLSQHEPCADIGTPV